MKKSKAWIKAMRLRTLPLALSTVLTGSFFGFVGGGFTLSVFFLLIFTTVSLQILSNLANDYGDAVKGTDNANRVGPERAIQSGVISIGEMKKGIILFVALSFVSGVLLLLEAFGAENMLLGLLFLLLGIGAIYAAIKYTVGKNAYGYSGLGDVFVFLFFGIVGVMGSEFVYTKELNWLLLFPSITIGFLSAAVLNMNNMRDIENDRACGKNTIVVKMGFDKAKYYHLFLILGAFLSWLLSGALFHFSYVFYISYIPFFMLIVHLITVMETDQPQKLDPELKKIALSTFMISLLCWFVVII